MPTPKPAADGGPYDITIVGAGMAGLYAAWRLVSPAAQQSPLIQQLIAQNGTGELQLCFIEEGSNVGGRLDSYTFNNNGADVTVELGGMRFQKSQLLVWELIQNMQLKTSPFPISDNRLFYVRDTLIWEKEIQDPNAPVQLPFHFLPGQKNLTPDQLFNLAVSNVVGNIDAPNWSAQEWQQFTTTNTYTSPPSNAVQVFVNASYMDIGFWDLLYDQVGQEGYRYLTEAGGYDSNTINWNSALAMPYVASGDYSSTATYWRIDGGYQILPMQIAQDIGDQLAIQLNTRLVGITKDSSSGLLNLTVANGPTQSVIQSKYVLLCMPKRSLELLDPDTEFSTSLNQTLIDSVMLQPSFKLLLLFEEEWWKDVNIRGTGLQPYGPTITDLPLRMIWYFDDETTSIGGKQDATQYWALLASYSDMATEQFWIGFRDPTVPGGGVYGQAIPAPPAMVNMALFQLGQVHGFTIPQPVAAVYKDWAVDPFGAGYHAWATHVQPWLKYNVMLNPVPDYNVYVCGEAFSLDQGWVEGALRTAESVLTQYFQLPVYPGVPESYVAVRP